MEKRVLNGNLPVIVEPMAASNTDNTYNTNTNTNTNNFNSGGFGERRQSLHHAQSNDEKSAVHGGSVVKGQLPPTPAPILSFKTPKNTLVYIVKVGMAKGAMSALNIFLLSFLSGLFVGYGALSVYIVYGGMDNGPGSLGALSPGFAKFIGACNFPVALMMIIFCGGELFTGNTMYLPAALMARKITVLQAAKSWFFSYFGNFAGCAVHAYFLTYLAQELTSDPWHTFIQHLAEKKIDLGWGVVFLKGIGANMLVCIAVFMAIASDSYSGKVAACFFPIICFFICGYEHCVANMYTILAGLFYGADRTFGQFIYRNLIPATLGNACGAFTFIACLYYVYNEDTREGLTKIELRQGKHRKNPTWRSFHFPGAHIFSHNPFRSGHPSGTASPTNGIIGGNLDSASTDLMLGNGGIGASRPYSTTTSSSHIARV